MVPLASRCSKKKTLLPEPQNVHWNPRVHGGITCHQPKMLGGPRLLHHCQRLVPRRPTFWMPKIYRKNPQSSSDKYPCLSESSLMSKKKTWRLLVSSTTPRPLSIANETPPDVCLKSSLPAFSSVNMLRLLQTFILASPLCWTFPPSPLSSACDRFRRRWHTCRCTIPCTSSPCSTLNRWTKDISLLSLDWPPLTCPGFSRIRKCLPFTLHHVLVSCSWLFLSHTIDSLQSVVFHLSVCAVWDTSWKENISEKDNTI